MTACVIQGEGAGDQAENVERSRSERLLPKLADVIKSVSLGWPYRDSIFLISTEPYKPCNFMAIWSGWSSTAIFAIIAYQWIPEKGYYRVVVLKPFEGRTGLLTRRPILGA